MKGYELLYNVEQTFMDIQEKLCLIRSIFYNLSIQLWDQIKILFDISIFLRKHFLHFVLQLANEMKSFKAET